jgi:molybdopterin-guanine dinucleotide biosynthesis protein A
MGVDKAFLEFEGRPLIARVIQTLGTLSDDLIIATNRGGNYAPLGPRIVPDLRPDSGPLGGIAAGLEAAKHDLVLVAACDMPFLNPAFLRFLAGKIGGADAAVPQKEGQYEPLHAAYKRTCLPSIRSRLSSGDFQAFSFYSEVEVVVVAEEEWRKIDPEGLSLVNINHPQDLARFENRGPNNPKSRRPK